MLNINPSFTGCNVLLTLSTSYCLLLKSQCEKAASCKFHCCLYSFSTFIYSIKVKGMRHHMHTEVRGQLLGVSSLQSPHGAKDGIPVGLLPDEF